MEKHGDEIHVTTDEARAGSTPHIVRYVLIISMVLTIIGLSVVWVAGTWNMPKASTPSVTSTKLP